MRASFNSRLGLSAAVAAGSEGDDRVFRDAEVEEARCAIEAWPEYHVTPLVELPALAKQLSLGGLWIKDEGSRPLGGRAMADTAAAAGRNRVAMDQGTRAA